MHRKIGSRFLVSMRHLRQIPFFIIFYLSRNTHKRDVSLDIFGGFTMKLWRQGKLTIIASIGSGPIELPRSTDPYLRRSTLGNFCAWPNRKISLLGGRRFKRSALKDHFCFFGLGMWDFNKVQKLFLASHVSQTLPCFLFVHKIDLPKEARVRVLLICLWWRPQHTFCNFHNILEFIRCSRSYLNEHPV